MRGGNLFRVWALISGPYFRVRIALLAVLLAVWLLADGVHEAAAPITVGEFSRATILDAIRMVESSDRPNPPDGDDGLAIGPYQIHQSYWTDSGVQGSYTDCRQRRYAERVIEAYMHRYVAKAWRARNAEVIARTHNGGPRGRDKSATDKYWNRVATQLRARR